MFRLLLSLVFPRDCIGCGREDLLLCRTCAEATGPPRMAPLAGLQTVSCLPYAGVVRQAITEFKHGRRAFADDLAMLIEPFVDSSMTLVPVPTTRRRRAQRGFDQTVLLARLLQRRRGVQVCALLSRRSDLAQHGRSRSQRLAATGRFGLRQTAVPSGALILFDDVRTTGATLLDAARTLACGGFQIAGALTLAWTPELT
jgi:ComF family protein